MLFNLAIQIASFSTNTCEKKWPHTEGLKSKGSKYKENRFDKLKAPFPSYFQVFIYLTGKFYTVRVYKHIEKGK